MFRFIQIVLSVIVVLSGFTVTATDTKSYTALKFAFDGNNYVSYSPDMARLTDKFTICVWVRKLQTSGTRAPFGYKDYEIFMTDNGYYNRLFSSTSLDGDLTSKFTSPVGTWFMYCSTWSLASRTFRVYVNGQLAGTETTPSGRKLQTGGALTVGNRAPNSGHRFGGELFNFNVYEKELTATEVAAMSSGGLCTEIPEQLKEYRVIKWESILKLSRSGTVQDLDTVCTVIGVELQRTRGKLELAISEKSTLQLSLNRTQTELLEVQGLFNSTQEELVGVKRDLGVMGGELNDTKVEQEGVKKELGGMGGELNETKVELEGVKKELGGMGGELNETKVELEGVKKELGGMGGELNDTKVELEGVRLELGGMGGELNETKVELEGVRLELGGMGGELNDTKVELEGVRLELGGMGGELNDTKVELEGVRLELGGMGGELNETKVELEGVKKELGGMGGELNDTKVELEGVRLELGEMGGELNETKSQLKDTQLELEDNKLELKNVTESKCALQKGNLTKWDMLYAPAYYNKTFTRRLYQQLTTTWDSISSKIQAVYYS